MSQPEIDLLIVFRRITEALDSLSEEEIRRLSNPQYSIDIRALRRRQRDDPTLLPTDTAVEDVIKEVTALLSRQEAQALLDARYPSKKALEVIARRLDIPIVRHDKVEDLRDKIVEATVGSRIRSQAIQGTGV